MEFSTIMDSTIMEFDCTTIIISVVCFGCQIIYEGLKVLENQLQVAST